MASGQKERIGERRKIALELRQAGVTYRDIATMLSAKGFECSFTTAYNDVKAALDELLKQTLESAEHIRTMELKRLDAAMKALWPKIAKGNEAAIDRMLRIQDRRARYLGLDAPAKVESTNFNVEAGELETPDDEGGRLKAVRDKIESAKETLNKDGE